MHTPMAPKMAALTGSHSDQTLDALRRKSSFRAWNRGTKEADLLIGTFADRYLAELTADEVHQFSRLLEEDDPVIDDWVKGRQSVPQEHDNNVMALLRQFCLAGKLFGEKHDRSSH